MATLALALYLAMFLIVFVLRSIIQYRRTGDTGRRAGVLGAAPGSADWVAGWMLVVAMVAALAAPIADLAGMAPLVDVGWIGVVGTVLAVLAVALTFAAQMSMGAEWRIGVDVDERTGLVTGGAFGVVRNPIFSAMILFGIGLTMMVVNVISIAGLVALVAAIELQVRAVEEPHLRVAHGEAYADYCARVGRFVPGFGRS